MIINKKEFKNCYQDDEHIYIDIETTGFSKLNNHIYLIGLGFQSNKIFTIYQFFAENKNEEKDILIKANKFINNKKIANFNGDTFDLPFILAKSEQYNIDKPSFESIDYYKFLKERKNIISTKSLKLKELEKVLNIYRNFNCNGADSIKLYREVETGNEQAITNLLKYNAEDVYNLFLIKNKLYELFSANTISTKNNLFYLTGFKISKDIINIELTSINKLENGIYNIGPIKIEANLNKLNLVITAQKQKYDEVAHCRFIEKNQLPVYIENSKCINSPKQILIISYKNEPIIENILNLSQALILHFTL